ncbi:probable protein phosphatase 2C 22 [Rutidosis leptorrhynchoides]|uniref:probable protein phosphatase 2C 22 n=1 Tax=Rutidosis leptorrhynchoides TaxID=125765 RepID=UPI003A99FA9B
MTMEGVKKVVILENGTSSSSSSPADGKPPNPLAGGYRRCFADVIDPSSSSVKKSLVRHPSLVRTRISEASVEPIVNREDCKPEFIPLLRSGAWSDIGIRGTMEDVYICADSYVHDYGGKNPVEGPAAFYAVFDGHGGKHAAHFACDRLPRFIFEDDDFPMDIEGVITSAFAQTDTAFAEACTLDADLASGTTALAALVIGRSLVVANAGDCRAVLCRRGKAIEMSRDHKPICIREKKRIEASGGYVYDGYLNGQINVARAIGDWHMDGLKNQDGGPLSSEPEFMTTKLTEEDEFLIIGCDGIWDVFMSQNAVDFARRKLQEHNDPVLCSQDLVNEALKRKSGDNLSAVVVCFQSQPPPNLVVPRGRRVQRSVSAEGLKELQGFLDGLET